MVRWAYKVKEKFLSCFYCFKMSYVKTDVYVKGSDTAVRKILMVRIVSKSQDLIRNLSVVTWKILIDHCLRVMQ